MNILKLIFNKIQLSPNECETRIEVNEKDDVPKNSSCNLQSFNARDIQDSIVIQYIEDHNHGGIIIDQKISDDIQIIRKSRFFTEFDTVGSALALARRVVKGELCDGSDSVRSRALAWCSRLLSRKMLEKAEEYLQLAKELGSCPEIQIAEAFICSQKGEKNSALSILAGIDLQLSRSAALMVVATHEGPQAAIDWLKASSIDVSKLDSDGKYFLLANYQELQHWESAKACIETLTADDLLETPVLNHMIAMTWLISTVPNEFRASILKQLPFEAESFPLASDNTAIVARKKAHHYFIVAAEVAEQLKCPRAATIDDDYALWLELKDPEEPDQGIQRLSAKLRDPKSALRLVHLGLQFRIKLDLEAIEREIQRQIALNGEITQDAAIARFALAFTKNSPEAIANYIAQHSYELCKFFDKKSIRFLETEMLSQAGLTERAEECLAILVEEGLSEAEESRLRRIISEVKGINPVEARKEQFKKTNSLADLVILVDELETRGEWGDLCEYGQILFNRTRSLHDAEHLAKALNNTQKTDELLEFLKINSALLPQSRNLQMLYCWSLYYEGALLEARSELAKLKDERDNPNYRALQINLGIALGDWNSLTAIVANVCLEKDKRNARELLSAAQLALNLGTPHAKELIFLAAEKGNDDASILATAYFLASSAGWEDNVGVSNWLTRAVELSGEDGPIKKISLEDVFNLRPDWDHRETEIWQLLSRGDIPMFLAAESLNKSLVHLMLFPSLVNISENDPRRRGVVPAYSGKRQPKMLETGGTVAMDATALLTLSFMNLLGKAFAAFDTVYLPHATLTWLFEEKQKVMFHQPSRIKNAHHVHHLLATGVMEKLVPSTIPDSELSAQIGDELALLIAEAKKDSFNDDTQRVVIRPYPVHRIASLMEEVADLTEHSSVLSSCQALIDKLRQKGQLTAEEEKKALIYLEIHEKPWPNQPIIADGAILYLDDLAITYFLDLGILEKLKSSGFRLIASPREVLEANELISYEGTSGKINNAIELIRSTVNSRIELGKIKVGKRNNIGESEKQNKSLSSHPTVGVIDLAKDCKALIVDDRFLNQHENIDDGKAQAPIFTTMDLLDALVYNGFITAQNRLEYRTLLRRAGYCFVPVSYEELECHLKASMVKDDKLIETAELKAIRENILRIRMSNWLQLPKEATWLDILLKTFIQVLQGLWKGDTDFAEIRVRSNWIISQIDVLGWAHRYCNDVEDNMIRNGHGAYILLLLSPTLDEPKQVKDEYWNWAQDMILAPIKEEHPALYNWIIEWYKKMFTNISDKNRRA